MSTLSQARVRAATRRGSMKYDVRLCSFDEPTYDHQLIRDWCNESIGNCYLLWEEDIPGMLYSFNCKKDAVLFALRWL